MTTQKKDGRKKTGVKQAHKKKEAAQPFRPAQEPVAATVPIPRPRAVSLPQALSLASRHQEAGRLQEAEKIVRQILRSKPDCAPAWHILGLVAHGAGRPEMAIDFVGRAVKFDGRNALYHANLGEMNRLHKRLDEAISCGKRAVALDPRLVSAQGNLGIAYFDREDYDKAEACHRAALKLDSKFAPSLNNLGSICRERHDDAAALEWYEKARAAQPGYLEPLNNIGATLLRADRTEEAVAVLREVLKRQPRYAEAHCNMGFALLDIEKTPAALASFRRALKCRPAYADAYIGIARLHKDEYELEAAEAAVRRALALEPDSADAYCTLGSVHNAQGRPDLAKQDFERALALEPGQMGAQIGLGNLLLEAGRLAEAEAAFRAAATGPDRFSALFSLVQAKKVKSGDPELAQLEAEDIKALPPGKAIHIHFALGKAYDDIGEPDKAFPHFIEGCKIKRARLNYDADEKDRVFAGVRKVFSREFIESRAGGGCDSNTPIFVLGMPRSGTTLTEQIIASHPDVYGAGEIFDLLDVAGSRVPDGQTLFPGHIAGMTPAQLAEMGGRYVESVKKLKPDARKITDKMPINFLHIGLIHLILPRAKIVHVNRHPLDTCLSCFTRLFAHNQDATYDLKEMGRFYHAYNDMMKHWKKVLPAGSFYDISYEELVEDTETEARRLIDYCGLDWNDACLAFHRNERSIRTASLTQVRQPVYKSSVARWKKYEKFLGPLIEGLGDALESET